MKTREKPEPAAFILGAMIITGSWLVGGKVGVGVALVALGIVGVILLAAYIETL